MVGQVLSGAGQTGGSTKLRDGSVAKKRLFLISLGGRPSAAPPRIYEGRYAGSGGGMAPGGRGGAGRLVGEVQWPCRGLRVCLCRLDSGTRRVGSAL